MSEPHESQDEPIAEEVDALLVESEERIVLAAPNWALPATRGMVPAVQAAAVAAGGFVAGAAVVGLVSRRHNRAALAAGSTPRRRLLRRSSQERVQALQIVSTRSLLVDIHLLGGGEQG